MSSFVPPPLHSTPTQVRVQTASNTLKTSELHLLQNELRDNIVPNVEFDFFVKEVLKFSGDKYETLVQSVREEQLGSVADWSQLFAPIIASGGEPFIYDPLVKLVHWIQDQLREKLSWESTTDLKFRNTWSKPLGGSEADRKPDITAVSGRQDSYPKWKEALVVWEVKHRLPKSAPTIPVSNEVSREHLFPIRPTPRPYSDPGALVSKKRCASPEPLLGPACKKNKSNSASQTTKVNTNTNSTSRKSESSLEQLLSYSLEAMTAQPHRRYVVGLLLDGFQLQLVFHCRSFVLTSAPFDIQMDPGRLAVAVAALWLADLETLGFEKRFISDGETALNPIGSEVSVGEMDTIVKRILYKARALFGRGSSTLLVADKKDPSALYVIKISCQVKTRVPESEFLEAAADIPNVIHMAQSASWGDMLEGFGEEFLRSVQEFEPREFRVLVLSPVCELLTAIKEVPVFKACFVKLVKAHHALFERGILHCDISVGNLMYDPKTQEPYLIDADLGKSVNQLGTPSSNHRTGTLPFMAIDLLVAVPPPHLYRHDLESFFYVLVWICAEDQHGWHRVDSVTSMAEKKSYFLSQFEIEQLRIGKFVELKLTWITQLHSLFAVGAAQKLLWTKRKGRVSFDNETLDGEVTYETFMKVIGDSP
ncbi:hypothetical protein ACGC1H_006210 [Rhizoctonia solani]|uniref:Protein kinase domain-containing protein n=1 Tax=Rhizoctonia solani TaxID=456999 RepID=A0A8H3C8G4_9AGAM|nr:unnamed protein product [Rhizoctonia solani]